MEILQLIRSNLFGGVAYLCKYSAGLPCLRRTLSCSNRILIRGSIKVSDLSGSDGWVMANRAYNG